MEMSLKPQKFIGASLDFTPILEIFKSKLLSFFCLEKLTSKKKNLRGLKFSQFVGENMLVFLILF